MKLEGKKIGFVMTGSFCNFNKAFKCLEEIIAEGAEVTPVVSSMVDATDTRFGKAGEIKERLASLTGCAVIRTVTEAEPIGPKKMLDLVLLLPATGNSIAKLANGIIDTPALMAVKSHLRNGGPAVIAVASNDALGNGARNIGALLNARNIYFVPFGQDDPQGKPRSLVFKSGYVVQTLVKALEGKQMQPIIL